MLIGSSLTPSVQLDSIGTYVIMSHLDYYDIKTREIEKGLMYCCRHKKNDMILYMITKENSNFYKICAFTEH